MVSDNNKNGAVLVVGGGIGGIQTSLDLAESGFFVYLVESSPAIGGVMSQLDKTFPTNDCAMCIISPKLVECGRHLNIELITYADLQEVSGEAGNFKVKVLKKPRYIDLDKCTGCAECETACPVEVISEFDEGLSNRHAIYRPYPQAIPNAYTIEKNGIAPCRDGCPAGVKVQGYTALTSKGKFTEALGVVRETLPFPSICGRVCHYPCESECNLKEVDQAVSTRLLHKFLADRAREAGEEPPEKIKPTREEKVAIIGAGPSGLTCALRLLEKGYPVTVFEAADEAGGMITSCIPDYRSPKEISNYEIDRLLSHGIELKTNVKVGKDITLEQLRKDHKAVYIAIGAQDPAKLPVEGAEVGGVLYGLPFLRDVKAGKKVDELGQRVVVIGGGNVAIDCARSALRVGAKEVHLTCLETRDLTSRDRMPAHDWEIEEAEEEGVIIHGSLGPKTILSRDGKTTGLETRVCTSVYGDDGKFEPQYSGEAGLSIEADTVIIAIGQRTDLTGFEDVEFTPRGTIKTDEITLETNLPGVFSGGDIATGPASVIEAVDQGNRTAESIDRFLNGVDLKEGRKEEVQVASLPEIRKEKQARIEIPRRASEERVKGFDEIEHGFNEETAVEEANRCLNCAICSDCFQCVEVCGADAVDHQQKEETVDLNVGSIILAPGFDKFDATLKPEYGYGRFPNVITSIQFERTLSASGPFQGHLQRPSDGKEPKSIAFIQCVGSRDISCDRPYCSSVCCTYALKESIIAKEHLRGLECSIFYMDMRTYGKGFDAYLERAKEEYGVRLVHSRVSEVVRDPETENLIIKYESENGGLLVEEFDMVILSIGMGPPKEAVKLADMMGIELNEYDFAKIDPYKPVETSKAGIFACGAFNGPKDIPETVTQASSAAACTEILLSSARGSMIKEKEYPPEIDISGQEPRIGAFICHCGINIGGYLDVPQVVEYAKTLPGVIYAEHNLYTCSQDTQEQIKKMVKEHNLNRVVVASCTPRTHEPLFQETIKEGGLNPFLFEMANIRDQCSWVHMNEPEKATHKAKDLVRMAVARVALLEPLHKVSLGISHDALVIGGGVAGMVNAISLADQGFKTYLVEQEKELGGWTKKIHFPINGENPQDYLKSLTEQVEANQLIEVLTDSVVTKTDGFVGNFRTTVTFENGQKQRLIEHGVIIVATGAKEYRGDEYLLGQNEKVLTLSDLEEKLADSSQEVARAKDITMILCARPAGDKYNYCSRVCCTVAIKNALKIKERNPETNIYILYKDIRTYGFKEALYTEARNAGIIFIRYTDEKPPQVNPADDKIEIEIFDSVLGEELIISSDLLVLATPTVPSEGNEELSLILKVPLTKENFFHEAHPKLAPVDFASEGIFMCGTAHSPKFIDETIAQAQAAAGRATTILSKDQLGVGGVISQVDQEKCAACLTCVRVCPYEVPFINQDGVAEIEVAKCRGCGICVAECPRKAIQLLNYKDGQVLAKSDALLAGI